MKSLSLSARLILSLAVLGAVAFFPAAASAQTDFVIGSQNTVTADPPVTRPHEKPCIIQLYSGVQFADFNPKPFSYTPPTACPGPWEKIVFTADFNVTAGRQFDRTAQVSLGHVNLYYGTTAEPRAALAPSWHVERDVTDYNALFQTPQTGEADLGNVVNSTYTSIIFGSATLEFYSARHGHEGDRDDDRRFADAVYPLPNAPGGARALFLPTDQLTETFTLPTNVERAYLDVIAQSQINDEFWYTCVPNDVANELQSCGNTAFRETEISIDGQPAGVAPVYPWIFTGGIDPLLWEPIPGVQTLNFVPYRVDLTPFAGLLSNGQPHTVSLNVFNVDSYFLATATLLVFQDHGSSQVTGSVTANTIGAGPTPSTAENLQTDASGNITGSVTVTSARDFHISGFVETSHGRIDTDVHQKIDFSNVQNFDITATLFVQDIAQKTTVESRTITRNGPQIFATLQTFHYPLTLNITQALAADGTFSLLTTSEQEFKHDVLEPFFASVVQNKMNTTDTRFFDATGHPTGSSGQASSQKYTSYDTRGNAYSCKITAATNMLATVSEGCPGQEDDSSQSRNLLITGGN